MMSPAGRPRPMSQPSAEVYHFGASRNACVTLSAQGGAYSLNPGNPIYKMFRGGGKPALGPSTTVWWAWRGGFFV